MSADAPAQYLARLRGRNLSPAEWLARFGKDGVATFLDEMEAAHGPEAKWATVSLWRFWARPEQLPPPGKWPVWVLQAGRGWGKNRTGSEWVQVKAERLKGSRGALVARTAADVGGTVVRGVSGIMATMKPWNPCTYVPTNREVRWMNGTLATTYSSEEPDLLRGPNHHWGLADEFATWKATKAADGGTAWDHLRLGCRLEMDGEVPQIAVTTTPRPTKAMKDLLAEKRVVVTRGHQRDNASNLSADYVQLMEDKYGGTRMGRQELAGELLTDVEGAIVTLDMIDAMRLDYLDPTWTLSRVGIGVDPSGGASEVGIVAAGLLPDCGCKIPGAGVLPHFAVLADRSGLYTPEGWGRATESLYHTVSADRVFGERNYGGDMVESTLRNVDANIPYEDVVASRGKAVRAEPVLALYEQFRVHHVGACDRHGNFPLAKYEDEMTRFIPGEWIGDGSPNRADAGVWVLTNLSGRKAREFHAW